MSEANIRLGCTGCDRQDLDGITAEQLVAALKAGWQDVNYAEPEDSDLLQWETHTGYCPACQLAHLKECLQGDKNSVKWRKKEIELFEKRCKV